MWISSTNSTLEVESAGELERGGSSEEEMGEKEGEKKEWKEGGGESENIRWVNVEWGESGCATGVGEREATAVELQAVEEEEEEKEGEELFRWIRIIIVTIIIIISRR